MEWLLFLGGGWLVRFAVLKWGIGRYRFEPYRQKLVWSLVVGILPMGWLLFLLAAVRTDRAGDLTVKNLADCSEKICTIHFVGYFCNPNHGNGERVEVL